jgi:hypothetical protein
MAAISKNVDVVGQDRQRREFHCSVLGELLGVVGRGAAFEDKTHRSHKNPQIADPVSKPMFDQCLDPRFPARIQLNCRCEYHDLSSEEWLTMRFPSSSLGNRQASTDYQTGQRQNRIFSKRQLFWPCGGLGHPASGQDRCGGHVSNLPFQPVEKGDRHVAAPSQSPFFNRLIASPFGDLDRFRRAKLRHVENVPPQPCLVAIAFGNNSLPGSNNPEVALRAPLERLCPMEVCFWKS